VAEENAEQNTRSLKALFEAFNRHDIDQVMPFFADDCVFFGAAGSEATGTRFEGKEAIAQAFSQVWARLPDVQWRNTRHFSTGEFGLSEWLFTGTQADGKRIEAQGCDLFRFRDGKIVGKDAYRKDRPLLDPV
jgi:ketosteroid isomerase-like protein